MDSNCRVVNFYTNQGWKSILLFSFLCKSISFKILTHNLDIQKKKKKRIVTYFDKLIALSRNRRSKVEI